jgi:hypothetical protein
MGGFLPVKLRLAIVCDGRLRIRQPQRVSQVDVRLRGLRIKPDRLGVGGDGKLAPSQLCRRQPKIVVGLRVAGGELDGEICLFGSLLWPAREDQGGRQDDPRARCAGTCAPRRARTSDRRGTPRCGGTSPRPEQPPPARQARCGRWGEGPPASIAIAPTAVANHAAGWPRAVARPGLPQIRTCTH